jgi:hypothetical protein
MKEIGLITERDALIMQFYIQEDWDSFEELIDTLSRFFKANVTKRVDGPESKFVVIKIDNSELTLINNPYGNSLKAETDDSKEILQNIYEDWNLFSKL